MELNEAIKSRKSVRNFTDKKPDWRDIIECIDSARYAPAAGNNFTLNFILVSDKKKIQKIASASEQSFIAKASYVVVAYSTPKRLINLFKEKGKIYSRQQAGAAIQNMLLKIEDKGLSTCWVGDFDEEQIKRELKIKKDSEIEALFPIGYASGKNPQKHKIELDRILYFESHGNKKMKTPKTNET